MPNIGPLEIAIVLVIVLVIFGPKRLPELGKSMGRGIKSSRARSTRSARRRTKPRSRPTPTLSRRSLKRPVAHADELPLVDHLDELRSRIIVTLAAFGVALALCFWQNHLLLEIANAPLPDGREPITFGVAEPFTTTLTVSAYAAILLTLPVLLYELYAFTLPALKPGERRTILPFLLAAPLLFLSGVVFAYLVVVPAATDFLLNFNATEFNVEIRAKDYYSFFALTENSP